MKKSIAVFAILFGAITLFKAGGVLFGPQAARDAVGNFVPFVVKFNFVAGFFYILAGIGIFLERDWALRVAALVALATIITAAAFVWHLVSGGMFEMQTVGAMAIRAGFWVIVTAILWRTGQRA